MTKGRKYFHVYFSSLWIFLGLMFLELTTCVLAQVKEDPPQSIDIYARSGDTVLLPCHQDLPTPAPSLPVALFILQWQRADSAYPFYVVFDSTSPSFIEERYTGRVSIPDDESATLQITNVSVQDAGTYKCQVIELTGNYEGVGNGTIVNLIILRPPEFLDTPSDSVVFREGNRQSLQCLSTGVPTPTVTWYKQGEQLRSSRYLSIEGDTITIEDVRRVDGGTYLCRAENSEGSLQDTTRVIVEGAPFIFIPPQDVVVLRSHEAVFQCEYEASPSNVSQRWYYEGAIVEELPQFANRHAYLPSGGLRIQNAYIEDEGKFLCSPSNGIGSPPSAFAFLTVQYPAYVISMPSHIYGARGEPVSIPCNSDAKPGVLRVLWRRNQREIAVSQSSRYSINEDFSLTIRDAQYSDVGAYSCIPYNIVGTEGPSDAAVLRVIERPSFATSPQSAYHVNINGSVELPCRASGNPPPEVQWRKVDGFLPPDRSIITSQGLSIVNLTKQDNGLYECSVSNEVATTVATSYVYVQMTTPHLPANVTVLTSVSSAYVAWNPGYNGGKEQTFTVRYRPASRRSWSQLTDIPETVSSILLYSLPPSTEYEFSVSAQNAFGRSGWTVPVSMETKADGEIPPDGTGTPQAGIPPSPPANLTLTVTSEGLMLSWKPPSSDSVLVSHYAIEYWIEGPWLVLEDRVPGESTEHLLTGLQVNTSYSFRLIAFSDSSFSEPSHPVEGDTWGMPVYRPTPPSQAIVDLTGILAGVVAGIFCFLCVFLLACFIISCMQRRKRNKRMVFFSVVAHSDQSSDDSQRLPPSPPRGFFGKHLSNIKGKLSPKPRHQGQPSITVERARPVQQNLRERFSKTSIGGRAGVYHVSSSEVLNTTVSGRVDHTQPRQFSDGSTVNGSEVMEAEELNGIRLMEATEQLDGYSDDNQWCDENVSLQRPHVKFQLTSVHPPPKPDRGTIEASLDSEDMTPSRQGPPVKSTPRPSNQSLPPVSISPLSISTNQESLSSADPRDVSIVGPLPDFRHFNGYHRTDTLSPPDSHHSASSGYGSRNTSCGTRSSQSRDSGPFNSQDTTMSNMSDVRNLPNFSQSSPGLADEQTKYDPELEEELMEALKRYYESDEDFERSKEQEEKEKKEKRCEELKKEFEEYRREQVISGRKSPRKTTVV